MDFFSIHYCSGHHHHHDDDDDGKIKINLNIHTHTQTNLIQNEKLEQSIYRFTGFLKKNHQKSHD